MAMEIVMGINLPNMKQMLEDCHDSKSKEFSKCMDLLIEAFADPSTNDRIKKILLDHSPVRRCLIAIFERIIYLDWQRSRFKELSHPLIFQVCLTIFSIVDEIKFCDDKTWFGGVSSVRTFTLVCTSPAEETSTSVGSSQQQRLNSIYYFSIGIIILGLMNKSEAIRPIDVAINAFLKRLESLYCSPSIFIDALLENDERCLSTLTALLNLWNNRECMFYAFELSISSLLNPDILLLSLLQKLHFDSLTFVDWIYSEPELSYVFLKTYSQHLAQLSMQQIYDICNRFCKLPQNNEAKYDINRMEMDSSPSSSESNLTFAIEELHGEQTVLKEIVIPTKSNYSICQRQERRIADAESMCSSLYNFLVKLNSKLDKLCPAIHFPVKIICQNLSTIEATMSGNAFYD